MNIKLFTPVVFIIYNRPDKTEIVFNAIRKAQPETLYIIADGPKKNNTGDNEKCSAVKRICNSIDWNCKVFTNYADQNMGCKKRVSSGLDWVFEQVNEAIILEDDCLPHPTFYQYCQELLVYYRNNENVMMISGDNFQNGIKRGNASYYFSRVPHIWGWATWKRAWKLYDVSMKSFPYVNKAEFIKKSFKSKKMGTYWYQHLEQFYYSNVDTWDHQWTYTVLSNNGFCINPNTNLISNIGFGVDALHTKDLNSKNANMSIDGIDLPLIHPSLNKFCDSADYFTFRNEHRPFFHIRIFKKITKLLKKIIKNV